MREYHNYQNTILELLKKHPDGLSIKTLSVIIECHRNSAAKNLDLLHSQGRVDLHADGRTKIYTISSRIPFEALNTINSHHLLGVNRNLEIVEIGASFLELLGISDPQPASRNLQEVPFSPFHDPVLLESIRSAVAGREHAQIIESYIKNKPHSFQLKCVPTIFNDRKIGAAILLSPITDTEGLYKIIENVQEQYRILSEIQEEYIVRFYPDGTIIFANKAYCRGIGYSVDTIVGTKHPPVLPDEDAKRLRKHFSSLSPDHPVATIEHRCILPDGSIRWQRWKDRCIFRDGKIAMYHSVGSDITDAKLKEEHLTAKEETLCRFIDEKTAEVREINQQLLSEISRRKKLESGLKESELRYRSIVQSQAELVCRWKPDGKITFVNDAVCTYLGIPREHLIDTNCLAFLPPEDQQRVIAHVPSMTPSNPYSQIRHRMILPDTQEQRWQQWYCTTFFDREGLPVEYQSVGRDITDLIHTEEALQTGLSILDAVFESASEGILVVDESGRILKYNTVLRTMLNQDHGSMVPGNCERLDELFRNTGFNARQLQKLLKLIQSALGADRAGTLRRTSGKTLRWLIKQQCYGERAIRVVWFFPN